MTCALLALWTLPALASAKPPFRTDPAYLIDNWEAEDGLPENSATAMVQTPDGYLWFGTFGGLVRFDGMKFRVLDPSNTPQLPAGGIVNLHLDRTGRLLVSTVSGPAMLSGPRWTETGSTQGWAGNFARTFAERPNGDLLVTTFDGKVLEYKNGRFRQLPAPPGESGKGYWGYADEKGRWWVVQHRFIGWWDGGQWVQALPLPPNLGAEAIGCARARDGGLWLLLGQELVRYRAGAEVSRVSLPGLEGGAWSISEDSGGNVWICSQGKGLYQVRPTGEMRHWTTANGLAHDGPRFTFEDREGNIWVGSSGGGLTRFKPRRFRSYGAESGLTERNVNSVSADRAGKVWVATYGGGLFSTDGERMVPAGPASSVGGNLLGQSVLADRAGRVWFGTFGQGLWRLDAQREGEREAQREAQVFRERTGGGNVLSMFEDSRGRVWMAGGETVAVHEDGVFRELGKAQGIATGGDYFFAEHRDGELWLANAGGVFRQREGRFVEVLDQGQPIRETGCLKADADGTVWIGSRRGSLLRWRSGQLAKVDGTSGLPPVALRGLIDDDHGHTWMATNRGVVRARLSDLHAVADGRASRLAFQVFEVSDGLPTIECPGERQPVCARDGRGRLWFATRKGPAVVDPADVRINASPPPARVEEFAYISPSAAAGGGGPARGEVVRWNAPFAPGLSLPAGSRHLEFRYTALSFTAPEKVRFQTKVEGRDADWLDMGAQRAMYFHAPGPGRYVFRVRAANNDGTWGEPGEGVAFVVEPYLYQTLWFGVAVAAVLAGGGAGTAWAVVRSRHRRARRQLKRSQRQSAALVKLSGCSSVTHGDVSGALREISATAADVLGVHRASVWLLNDAGDELHCAGTGASAGPSTGAGTGDNGHDGGPVLRAADCPEYFEALRSGRVIDAADALRDGRTRGVARVRLASRGISSVLDAAVRMSGRLVGVIRHEHVGPRRAWREDEVAFAAAAADQVAQALLNDQREKALLRLRNSEQRMSLAAEAAHLGMWQWQIAENRVWMTDRCRALFGLTHGEQVTSEMFLGCIHPEDRASTEHAIRAATARHGEHDTFEAEYRVLLLGGQFRWVFSRGRVEFDDSGAPAGVQGVSADITRRKQAEAEAVRQRNELAHLSRVTMLGELSGSLAHELNQPLTAILSNAQSAQRFLAIPNPDLNEIREILRDIVQEDKRAGEVIRRLRLLLKKGEVQQEPLNLNEVALEVLRLMRSDLVNGGVEVSTKLGEGLPAVWGDRVQLQQVLINLVVNASDAMGGAAPGRRRLSLTTGLDKGEQLQVSVRDEGVGLPAGRAESVFEPFFTTKPGGMGLGLAVCRTIVRAHGGRLWAENNSGRGATFYMTLPANAGGANGASAANGNSPAHANSGANRNSGSNGDGDHATEEGDTGGGAYCDEGNGGLCDEHTRAHGVGS